VAARRDAGLSRRAGQRRAFKTGLESSDCRSPGVGATGKWKFRVRSMTSIAAIARKFFEACETEKGWEGCKQHCKPGATFSAQAEPLADTRTLQQYMEWM